ncbi:alpha/beta hydrolase [Oscillospiraceae bacterium MB08-C2-2]|nr:alpha/beta hydrolase [Oscillospiraceae bacterium MB08-C2-2]
MVKTEEIRYQSANGVDVIAATAWQPTCQPIRGIVQISHSLHEYIELYSDFANYLAERGYIVCGEDHLGHGRSARDAESLGFSSESGGAVHVVRDTRRLYRLMKQSWPNIPYFMLGQGTGGFIVRLYMTKYKESLDGCLLGASQINVFRRPFMEHRIKTVIDKHGIHYRTEELLDCLNMNCYCQDQRKNSQEWLSRDPVALEAFLEDKWCNFVPTAAVYRDMLSLLLGVSWRNWARCLPKDLPLMLFSGDKDPFSRFGKATRTITSLLEKSGLMDLTTIIYRGGSHAFWMEVNREQIFADIVNWLNQHTAAPSQETAENQPAASI